MEEEEEEEGGGHTNTRTGCQWNPFTSRTIYRSYSDHAKGFC